MILVVDVLQHPCGSRLGSLALDVVSEVPGAHLARLKPDEGVVVAAFRVRRALLDTEVPDRDVPDEVGVGATEHGSASDLDATVGRVVLEDDDARPWVFA